MGEVISYRSNGGTSEGYLAVPPETAREQLPGVLVIQEYWGLVGHITPVADRVAAYGYAGTGHAFFNDDRPEAYDEAAAILSWDRTLTFLHDKLGPS